MNNTDSSKIVCMVGPTAVGKTELSLKIAEDMNMEIVSMDSMQVYKYMDIGSAKPTCDDMKRVPHHMIDVLNPTDYSFKSSNLSPSDYFSAYKYSEMAEASIDDILERKRIPFLVGGTGLYLDSIIYDIDFAAVPSDESLRAELYEIAESEGPNALHDILSSVDNVAASRIHPNNIKRVVRAIESAKLGSAIKDYKTEFEYNSKYSPILIGLKRDRSELYERINKRVDILIEHGLVDEVNNLKRMGMTEDDYPMKGIGYKELMAYLNGIMSLEDCITLIKTNSRHYAKRQMTWFKKYEDMKWFDLTGIDDPESLNEMALEIEEWLKTKL